MSFFDRRLFKGIDWPLLGFTLGVIVAGLPVMYSASLGREGSPEVFNDHLLRLGVGLVVLVVAALPDYRSLCRWSFLIYGLNVMALLATALAGVIGYGARRWLGVGALSLQPSELMKVTMVLTVASFAASLRGGKLTGRDLGIVAGLAAVPLLLILKQPDLGTAGILFLILLAMTAMTGVTRRVGRNLALGIGAVALVGLLVAKFDLIPVETFLKPYQMKRILVLFDPDLDPLGASYHVNQSKIAIGSGGLLGKGFLNGSQNRLRFLPEQHTDFIFSVLAEEWGFAGVLLLMSLYLGLILAALRVARDARDRLGSLIATGVTSMIFFHVVINLAMTAGWMPVVGLPLPLMSFGGTSFLVTMAGIGLLQNIRMRRSVG